MRKLSIFGFALLLAGCAGLKPDYTKPAVDLPAGWRDAPADGVQARDARWWKVYGDPVLDRLVDEALAHNANVMLAIARVDEARAALSATAADQRPQINASASRSRTRISQRGPTPLSPGFSPESNDTRAAVGVSYEIDLWGRLRNATQAARADLLATEAARETGSSLPPGARSPPAAKRSGCRRGASRSAISPNSITDNSKPTSPPNARCCRS